MMLGLMYPNGLVWCRANFDEKEDRMMLGFMSAIDRKRAREERERLVEAQQVQAARRLAPAGNPERMKKQAERKTWGVRRLAAALGVAGR